MLSVCVLVIFCLYWSYVTRTTISILINIHDIHSHPCINYICSTKELVYAELHHSTNPPAPPLPAEPVPVQYANITRTQTDSMQPVTTQEW